MVKTLNLDIPTALKDVVPTHQQTTQPVRETARATNMPVREVPKTPVVKDVIMPQTTVVNNQSVDKSRTYLYETNTGSLSRSVFSDGVVTPQEMITLQANHNEIIRDFLVSVDMLDAMEKNPTAYSAAALDAARFVVNRLMRAREKSYATMDKASFYNHIPPQEKQLRAERLKRKEHLDIEFNLYQIFALNGNARDVISYARKQEKSRVMTPQEIKKTEQRIMSLVNEVVEKGQDERHILQFLEQGLERAG